MKIKIYDKKHAFVGDTYVGSIHRPNLLFPVVELEPQLLQKVVGQATRAAGRPIKLTDQAPSKDVSEPLKPLPAEVEALKDPMLGMETPAVLEWCKENLPPGQFDRRYPNRKGENVRSEEEQEDKERSPAATAPAKKAAKKGAKKAAKTVEDAPEPAATDSQTNA